MSDENIKQKPFGLIFLTTLRVAKFDTKDEWYDAMRTLKKDDKPFVAVKYHHGAERYVMPETEEFIYS